jgi:hypothetical protein
MTKTIAGRTIMLGAMLASTLMLNSTANAQTGGRNGSSTRSAAIAGTSAPSQFQRISSAMSSIMQTEEFKRAERANDVRTMRALLSGYGLQVLDPEPQLIPNCQPPYGTPYWAWSNFNGVWMYGWVCLRNGGGIGVIDPPISLPD